ncbi:MAG: hypothetical protein AAGG44_00950 [Planctomycetota bacterium]
MTLLGKVFTGLIFFMSLMFFTFAIGVNASHVDTKQLAADYEAEARASVARNGQLEELRDTYKEEVQIERDSRSAALASLQRQLELANFNFLQQEAKASELRKQLTETAQTNQQTQADLKTAASENRKLREQLESTVKKRDELFDQLIKIRDEFNQLQGVYQSLRDRAEATK